MKKEWIDPNDIYLVSYLNPRQLNQGFIESLVESMQMQGFLPQYPVSVFRTENLSYLEMREKDARFPFVCASGMHRTTAAQLAKVDKILCKVYDAGDDTFIEMMMTDNFEHDPARNSEIGQVFSQREKRRACTRLLYIPKFLKMTNSALAQGWHTSEANVRRWRKDVESSLDEANEGSTDFIPASLRQMGITPRRLEDLNNIRVSREREDAEGNVVQIRTAPKEPTEEEKAGFWEQIRHDAGDYYDADEDVWLEKHGIGEFKYVREYLTAKYGLEERYHVYRDLTMKQLRDVHGAILSDDADFIAGCKAIGEVAEKFKALKTDFRKNCESIEKWLLKFVQGDKWSDAYKKCSQAFKEAARAAGYTHYYEDYYSYPTDDAKPETYESANEVMLAVQRDIAEDAGWVVTFREKIEKRVIRNRQNLEKDWGQAKDALADAFTAYPRNISPAAFCAAMDSKHYDKDGTHFKLFSRKEIGSRVHDGTIRSQIRAFKDAARDLKADAEWVQKIPSEDTPVLRLDEYVDFEISHIYIEVAGKNGQVFHPEGAVFSGDKYDKDEDGNLKSKGLNLDAEAIACLSDATKADILNICRKNAFKHYTSHFDIGGPREEDEDVG